MPGRALGAIRAAPAVLSVSGEIAARWGWGDFVVRSRAVAWAAAMYVSCECRMPGVTRAVLRALLQRLVIVHLVVLFRLHL